MHALTTLNSQSQFKRSRNLYPVLACLFLLNCGGTVEKGVCSTSALSEAPVETAVPGAPDSILRQYWLGLPDMDPFVANLRDTIDRSPPDGTDTLSSLQTHSFVPGQETVVLNYGHDFGERMRGFIKAPTTGVYQFLVSGDQQVQFFLSSNEQYEPIRVAIMGCQGVSYPLQCATSTAETMDYTASTQFTEPRQISKLIPLEQGRYYMFDWYHREGQGDTHAMVKWAKPGESVTKPDQLEIVPSSVLYYPVFSIDPGGVAPASGGGPSAASGGANGAGSATGSSLGSGGKSTGMPVGASPVGAAGGSASAPSKPKTACP